ARPASASASGILEAGLWHDSAHARRGAMARSRPGRSPGTARGRHC
ncbi:hypothetical protein GS506_05815, partial [Rhodococcus hoagii]|nr:hypothetical protein [Prescottella equi]